MWSPARRRPARWSPVRWSPAMWRLARRSLAMWSLAMWSLAMWSLAMWSLAMWSLAMWSLAMWSPAIWRLARRHLAMWSLAMWSQARRLRRAGRWRHRSPRSRSQSSEKQHRPRPWRISNPPPDYRTAAISTAAQQRPSLPRPAARLANQRPTRRSLPRRRGENPRQAPALARLVAVPSPQRCWRPCGHGLPAISRLFFPSRRSTDTRSPTWLPSAILHRATPHPAMWDPAL